MDYPPEQIMYLCVYLACKVEEWNVLSSFGKALEGDLEV